MHVVDDTRTGCCAEIHSQIKTRGLINLAQRTLTALGQIHQLISDLLRHRIKLARVQVRNDHHMTADVRIKIQHHEPVLTAMQDEIGFVVVRVLRDQAKHTIVALCINP